MTRLITPLMALATSFATHFSPFLNLASSMIVSIQILNLDCMMQCMLVQWISFTSCARSSLCYHVPVHWPNFNFQPNATVSWQSTRIATTVAMQREENHTNQKVPKLWSMPFENVWVLQFSFEAAQLDITSSSWWSITHYPPGNLPVCVPQRPCCLVILSEAAALRHPISN